MKYPEIKVKLIHAVDDPEKAVIPTIIFCSSKSLASHNGRSGFIISAGWWHYGIQFSVVKE